MYFSMQSKYVFTGAKQPAPLVAGALRMVMDEHAAGGMCGNTPGGMCGTTCVVACSPYSAVACLAGDTGLCAIAKCAYTTADHGLAASSCDVGDGVFPTDGMVGLDECAMPGKTDTPSSDSQWYTLSGNHQDGTCENGDASGQGARPCTWFGKMAQYSIRERAEKYSCVGHGQTGCVRDADGEHDSEERCIRHCRACVPSACLNGGECQHQAKAAEPFANLQVYEPFECLCPTNFRGSICQDDTRDIHSANFVVTQDGMKNAPSLYAAEFLVEAIAEANRQIRADPQFLCEAVSGQAECSGCTCRIQNQGVDVTAYVDRARGVSPQGSAGDFLSLAGGASSIHLEILPAGAGYVGALKLTTMIALGFEVPFVGSGIRGGFLGICDLFDWVSCESHDCCYEICHPTSALIVAKAVTQLEATVLIHHNQATGEISASMDNCPGGECLKVPHLEDDLVIECGCM